LKCIRNTADFFVGLHGNNVGYRNANTAAGRSFDIAFENITNYAGSVKTKTMGHKHFGVMTTGLERMQL
jgi:hypothetical protein